MSACGLPLGLDKCLNSLLQDNALTSWKIFASDSGGHTITLRLHPLEATRYGDQFSGVTGSWVRKGQAKVKRDRQRWLEHKDRQQSYKQCVDSGTRNRSYYDNSEKMTSDKSCTVKVPGGSVCDRGDVAMTQTTETETEGKGEPSEELYDKASTCTGNVSLPSQIKSVHSLEHNEASNYDIDRSNDTCTHRQYTSLFPDMFPDPDQLTTQQSRESNTQQPPPSSRFLAARDSRSEDGTHGETAGDGTEGGGDTDSSWSTESEGGGDGQDLFLETVRKRIEDSKSTCSSVTLERLKKINRNKSFSKVVIDRRGIRPERVVCLSEDVVLTFDTASGQRDFHVIERTDPSYGMTHGDHLDRICRRWPDIDRGGIYKECIEQMTADLKRSMVLVRHMILGQEKRRL